jgi:hypothetical protein
MIDGSKFASSFGAFFVGPAFAAVPRHADKRQPDREDSAHLVAASVSEWTFAFSLTFFPLSHARSYSASVSGPLLSSTRSRERVVL